MGKLTTVRTIDEIARLAGVSKTTISRYLNGKYEYMSVATRENIRATIQKTGYRPSNIARSMKTGTSRTIGCVIGDITNPVSANIVEGIIATSKQNGYSVMFSNTNDDADLERDAIDSFLSNRVDGLLINAVADNIDYLSNLEARGVPVVLLDRKVPGDSLDCVTSQNEKATTECLKHLHDQGYTVIGFFHGGFQENLNRYARRDAYLNIMKTLYGVDGNNFIYEVDALNFRTIYDVEKAVFPKTEESVTHFLSEPAADGHKAIFAINAITSMNLLWTLCKLGLDDFPNLGFCGFNDWGTAALVRSGVTTVTQDAYAIGEQAAVLLFNKIAGGKSAKQITIEVPNRLIIRRSTLLRML